MSILNTSDNSLIEAIPIQDKVRLLLGTGMDGISTMATVGSTDDLVPGAAGCTYPLKEYGIPSIAMADGPAGIRISPTRKGSDRTYYCTHFPIATLLSSTWDTKTIYRIGQAIGQEARDYGIDVVLAPAMNIMRNPLCGRNYEYYSEDPLLSGLSAAQMVNGIQSTGIIACLKHFAANNQETNRMNNDSRVDPDTLQNIYLRGFKIAVERSHPLMVMSSYNRLNGVQTSEDKWLLEDLLRKDWGWKGMIVSDWYSGKNAAASIKATNDMLQPGTSEQAQTIMEALKSGFLKEEDVNHCAERIIDMVRHTLRYKGHVANDNPDLASHGQLARRIAPEGFVLLENSGTLPIQPCRVVLLGCASYNLIKGGTGSGNVNSATAVTLAQALQLAGFTVDTNLEDRYQRHIQEFNQNLKPDTTNPFSAFFPPKLPNELPLDHSQLKEVISNNDAVIITIARASGEFLDRTLDDFYLSGGERELIESVCILAHAQSKPVIVLLNIPGPIEISSWNEFPDAILVCWQAGQETANAVADALTGTNPPSGHLPMSLPVDINDLPSTDNYPLVGGYIYRDPEQIHGPLIRNIDFTEYAEGERVGYRSGIKMAYPFGFGRTYTEFQLSEPYIGLDGQNILIRVNVTNVGNHKGKHVVQIYSSHDSSKSILVGLTKTSELAPGQTETVEMTIPFEMLKEFKDGKGWHLDSDTYKIIIATDAYTHWYWQSLRIS